jgi:cAMP-dependent protein kinase regulator
VAEEGEDEEIDIPMEAEIVEEEAAGEPMSAGQFADELMGLVDSVFQEFPGPAAAPAAPETAAPRGGSQIVVSPLFRDFAVDEMVAVIQGLKLLTFERGEAILREGQPGGSLYTLTSGRVRAFRKDPATGRQRALADLKEGAFFGEISILTGQPRMASIVALTRCELLELDRPTLDQIAKTHPHVWDVLREFAGKRAAESGR